LRVPGAGRGYPVVVAGGKDGDLPLTVAGAPEIVRAAMKNGVSIVLDLTDQNLSKADWKRIVKSCVRVMLSENAQHGLRHVFIEEAAEFIPQRVIDGDVYAEVEKLARIGGNSRLGYTLINQRSQEVSKAVLELCENLFLHRQKGKNALDSLSKWFDLADVAERKDIMKSLPNLPSGQCWAWMGGSDEIPLLIKVPPKNSHHPDRRAMRGDVAVLAKSAVDVGSFVSSMKVSLVEIEETDKANDPKLLRAEIARLTALTKAPPNIPQNIPPDSQVIENAERRGFDRGWNSATEAAVLHIRGLTVGAAAMLLETEKIANGLRSLSQKEFNPTRPSGSPAAGFTVTAPTRAPVPTPSQNSAAARAKPSPAATGDGSLSVPLQKIIDAIAWWNAFGQATPTNAQVGFVANYKPRGGSWDTYRSRLKSAGLIEYLPGGRLRLTAEGAGSACAPATPPTRQQFHDAVRALLDTPLLKLLNPLIEAYPDSLDAETWGEQAGYQPQGGSWDTYRSRLKGLDLITYPDRGRGRAADWLFP
jgi:hypothetical protein